MPFGYLVLTVTAVVKNDNRTTIKRAIEKLNGSHNLEGNDVEPVRLATPWIWCIKKGKQVFTFFCPKSTMNLTYLCYGIFKYKG
jgi:hypothetical protein